MFDKDHSGLTAKKGALIFFICLMLTATMMITNYLPYRTQMDFEALCTSTTTAKVFAVEEPYLDGNLYYGPMLEYYCGERGQLIHAEPASAVKQRIIYKEGDTVRIAYNPASPGDLVITDDRSVEERWKTALYFGIGIAVFGFVMLVIGCIRSLMGPDKELKARKFIKTPDGKTYNEWLEEQQKKQSALPADDTGGKDGTEE